jgi:hypothetical protein
MIWFWLSLLFIQKFYYKTTKFNPIFQYSIEKQYHLESISNPFDLIIFNQLEVLEKLSNAQEVSVILKLPNATSSSSSSSSVLLFTKTSAKAYIKQVELDLNHENEERNNQIFVPIIHNYNNYGYLLAKFDNNTDIALVNSTIKTVFDCSAQIIGADLSFQIEKASFRFKQVIIINKLIYLMKYNR